MTGPRRTAPEYQPWMDLALCAQTDPEAFFAEKGEWQKTADAKRICAACPVRAQCLEFALTNKEQYGVWGGLSERERRKLRKPSRYSNDQLKTAVRELHRAGLLDSEIATQTGVSDTHVGRVRRSLGLDSNRRTA
jgi:WhiB family redox-sensing transcriptional regulator